MPTVEETIEVEVPVRTAYNQWTQFEEFPKFMEGVEHVQQKDDTHLHWVASIGGKTEEWDAKITEQIPDQKIAWKATTGKGNAGIVTFQPISGDKTVFIPRINPATAVIAPTRHHNAVITRSGRIPDTRARSGLSATARICRPMEVK